MINITLREFSQFKLNFQQKITLKSKSKIKIECYLIL